MSFGSNNYASKPSIYPILQAYPRPGHDVPSHSFCHETLPPRTSTHSRCVLNEFGGVYDPEDFTNLLDNKDADKCARCGGVFQSHWHNHYDTSRHAFGTLCLCDLNHDSLNSLDPNIARVRQLSLRHYDTRRNMELKELERPPCISKTKTYRNISEPFTSLGPPPPPPTHRINDHLLPKGTLYPQDGNVGGGRNKNIMFIRQSYDLKSAGANFSTIVRQAKDLEKGPENQDFLEMDDRAENGFVALENIGSVESSIDSKFPTVLNNALQNGMAEFDSQPFNFADTAPGSVSPKAKGSVYSLQQRLDVLMSQVNSELSIFGKKEDSV